VVENNPLEKTVSRFSPFAMVAVEDGRIGMEEGGSENYE
jgi:hypothetical protein